MTFVPETAAEALLARLAAHGVDTLFANGGTDFASIIEAYARAGEGAAFPDPLVMPHETAAVAMAHGRYLATGMPQAVMAHVTVGLANCVMGVINAAADNVPLLIMSGKTPITEGDRLGARNVPIHWGQDIRDVSSSVRSACKWEYELRYAEEVEPLIDRAIAVAMTEPRGPVFLALPREPLAESMPAGTVNTPMRAATPAAPAPDPATLDRVVDILANAKRPLAISGRGDPEGRVGAALQTLAEKLSLPVTEFWPTRNVLASDHPLHAGYETGPLLAEADAVLVIDALVPWILNQVQLPDGCTVIQLGADPLFGRFPTRGFPVDIAMQGDPATALEALAAAVPDRSELQEMVAAPFVEDQKARRARAVEPSNPMSTAYISGCISEALGRDGVIVNELGVQPAYLTMDGPNRFFGHSLSAGLGWGFPAALGMAHADPSKLVAACIGDGSYMFANPVACGQIAEALGLPILVVVMHNGVWNAVRRATLSLYPEGQASRANSMAITSLEPAPDYTMVASANRGWSKRVDDPARLPLALAEGVRVVRQERRLATLEVMCAC
jgi:acetolactate synthase-1/2/3 large subunit